MAESEQKKVKLTLKVAMNQADVEGATGPMAVGDEVEVDADTAERWVAAGIADKGGGKAAPKDEPKNGGAGPTGRRR